MKNKDWVNPPNLFYQEVVYYDLRMDQGLKGEQVVYKPGHVLRCFRSRDLQENLRMRYCYHQVNVYSDSQVSQVAQSASLMQIRFIN